MVPNFATIHAFGIAYSPSFLSLERIFVFITEITPSGEGLMEL